MMKTLNNLIDNLDKIVIRFSEKDIQQAWKSAQSYSSDTAKWNTYIHQLCLNKLIPWLEEETGFRCQNNLSNNQVFVNSLAIKLNQTHLVIVPSESISPQEFSVPKEWVDNLNSTVDYYLFVEISVDENYLIIWGYTPYQQLKEKSIYDKFTKSYFLSSEYILENIEVMCWKIESVSLRSIKEKLINLSQWLANIFEKDWQTIEELFGSNYRAIAYTFRGATRGGTFTKKMRGRNLQLKEHFLILLVEILDQGNQLYEITLKVYSKNNRLPSNLQLIVFDETGKICSEKKASRADSCIELKLNGHQGDIFKVQITLNEANFTENFIV